MQPHRLLPFELEDAAVFLFGERLTAPISGLTIAQDGLSRPQLGSQAGSPAARQQLGPGALLLDMCGARHDATRARQGRDTAPPTTTTTTTPQANTAATFFLFNYFFLDATDDTTVCGADGLTDENGRRLDPARRHRVRRRALRVLLRVLRTGQRMQPPADAQLRNQPHRAAEMGARGATCWPSTEPRPHTAVANAGRRLVSSDELLRRLAHVLPARSRRSCGNTRARRPWIPALPSESEPLYIYIWVHLYTYI